MHSTSVLTYLDWLSSGGRGYSTLFASERECNAQLCRYVDFISSYPACFCIILNTEGKQENES
eukprot:1360811-Pyramimonas_sp.AAC.1